MTYELKILLPYPYPERLYDVIRLGLPDDPQGFEMLRAMRSGLRSAGFDASILQKETTEAVVE